MISRAARVPATPRPPPGRGIVDRVTFNAHIIETGTDSYRRRTTKTRTGRKRT